MSGGEGQAVYVLSFENKMAGIRSDFAGFYNGNPQTPGFHGRRIHPHSARVSRARSRRMSTSAGWPSSGGLMRISTPG